MHTVTWGPESSPRLPYSTHESFSSRVNHHVERGTNAMARSARRCDWEPLSGRWQLAPKDSLTSIKEDLLESRRSISACNARMEARALGSDVESLRPGTEEGME